MILREHESGTEMVLEMLPGTRGIIFGPYVTLAPGRYRALFNLGLGQAASGASGGAAVIDVVTGLGTHVLVAATPDASQFAGGATDVPLDFSLSAETPKVEFRTHSNGNGLVLHRVTLLRLDPPR